MFQQNLIRDITEEEDAGKKHIKEAPPESISNMKSHEKHTKKYIHAQKQRTQFL